MFQQVDRRSLMCNGWGPELQASRKQVMAAEDEILKPRVALSSKIHEQTHWLHGQLGSIQQQFSPVHTEVGSEMDKTAWYQADWCFFALLMSWRLYMHSGIKSSL
ncbi:hypothetical protein CTI12_AA530640 [Artemisia annua]|uniref:Uncharacterized protein n=1 Tax=Artemisia annua TaxID=35608 RepID=A0A2U1L2R9_ARTAN|nr:hypothetical protein CTI12_AA530640 [Artemisia annua]